MSELPRHSDVVIVGASRWSTPPTPRSPTSSTSELDLRLPVPLGGLAKLALLSVRLGYQDVRKLRAEPETTAAGYLSARLDDRTIRALVEPFLTGVFGHAPLLTPSRVLAMIWRSFVRGRIGVPAAGMGRLIEVLARPPPGCCLACRFHRSACS
jgi:phytoene dehydrogenase-like protein